MTTLESIPENKTETGEEEIVQKLTPEEQDEKYLIGTPENKKPDTPQINLERMPKAEYYWHASTTGVNGEILDSMLMNGIQPKEKLSPELKGIGNANTPEESGVFITTSGAHAANYLKTAIGYSNEGLPTFFAVKVEKMDTEYKYDTDLIVRELNEGQESKKNS